MRSIQTTSELARALAEYARHGEERFVADRIIADGYSHWLTSALEKGEVLVHETSSGSWVGQFLPEYVDRGWEFLRLSRDPFAARFRERYEKQRGEVMVDLTDPRHLIHQTLSATQVAELFGRILGEENCGKLVEQGIKSSLLAGNALIGQKLERFARDAYRGIFPTLRASGGGLSATFGAVDLRAFVTAGRALLTFARFGAERGGERVNQDLESVSCVASDTDPTGLRMGLQSVYATVPQAIALIEHVSGAIMQTPEGERPSLLKPAKDVCVG